MSPVEPKEKYMTSNDHKRILAVDSFVFAREFVQRKHEYDTQSRREMNQIYAKVEAANPGRDDVKFLELELSPDVDETIKIAEKIYNYFMSKYLIDN